MFFLAGDYDDYEFKERELSILEDLDYCLVYH